MWRETPTTVGTSRLVCLALSPPIKTCADIQAETTGRAAPAFVFARNTLPVTGQGGFKCDARQVGERLQDTSTYCERERAFAFFGGQISKTSSWSRQLGPAVQQRRCTKVDLACAGHPDHECSVPTNPLRLSLLPLSPAQSFAFLRLHN